MELFISDLYEVLNSRVKTLTNKKASRDPANIIAGIADIQSVLDELKVKAEQQALEIEKLKGEENA